MEEVVYRNVVFCEAETEKAHLLKFHSSKKVAWLPKSAFKIIDFKVNSLTQQEIYKVEIKKWAIDKIKYL
jgi:hypothetical protein